MVEGHPTTVGCPSSHPGIPRQWYDAGMASYAHETIQPALFGPPATDPLCGPVVKWLGGKTRLLPRIHALMPDGYGTYCEPFIGGGAVWLSLQPRTAVINDMNPELMNTYRMIRDQPDALLKALKEHADRDSKDHYLTVRAWDRSGTWPADRTGVERAARFLYLNRTCFNGMWCENGRGQMNSPYGTPGHSDILRENTIHALHRYLSRSDVTLLDGDYAEALERLKPGDFTYLDPPYIPLSATSSFTRYTAGRFDMGEQRRLREWCDTLTKRGIRFVESNSDTPVTRELYKDYRMTEVRVNRLLGNADRRGTVTELLISNQPLL